MSMVKKKRIKTFSFGKPLMSFSRIIEITRTTRNARKINTDI
jgi:hypothetical protein